MPKKDLKIITSYLFVTIMCMRIFTGYPDYLNLGFKMRGIFYFTLLFSIFEIKGSGLIKLALPLTFSYNPKYH